jgi:putative addiction module component (TIGR02574 family)
MSIDPQSDEFELDDELRAELDRRIDEDDENPEDLIPWEVVKAEALARGKKG